MFSQATIDSMTEQEVRNHLVKVANAKNKWKGDDDTKKKINEQFKMLMDKMKELR